MGVAKVLGLCSMEHMARETVQIYFDDLTGEPVEADEVRTIRFSWEGKDYIIDLSPKNADLMEKQIKPWVEVATEVKEAKKKPTPKARRNDLDQVREWARENGMKVSDRGRVAQKILDAYDNRNKKPQFSDGAKSDKSS